MTIDPRDAALMASCPCQPVPRFGTLCDMSFGQRTLVASNGVFTQVRLPWLDCVLRIAPLPEMPPLPYGALEERIEFAFGVIPVALLEEFVDAGREGLPNEVAGGLIFCARTGRLRLEVYDPIHTGPHGIEYRMPPLAPHESIALDLHTHGPARAFWSSTDDADDRGVKVCGVFGSLHRSRPTAAFRLAINGYYRKLSHPWERGADDRGGRVEAASDFPTLLGMGFTEAHGEWNI